MKHERLFLVALLGFLSVALANPCYAENRPDVVLIMAGDMGYSDVGCYGGEINTPNIDALANVGLRFTQFYNTGRCCPTRASLLTGLYPHATLAPGIGIDVWQSLRESSVLS